MRGGEAKKSPKILKRVLACLPAAHGALGHNCCAADDSSGLAQPCVTSLALMKKLKYIKTEIVESVSWIYTSERSHGSSLPDKITE